MYINPKLLWLQPKRVCHVQGVVSHAGEGAFPRLEYGVGAEPSSQPGVELPRNSVV